VRFATDGRRVRFGASLGPFWYWVREGPVAPDGTVVTGGLVDLFRNEQE
jgi:hypothetical protein